MAVRGVVTLLEFYIEQYDQNSSPLYSFQNYFEGTRTINSRVYTHNYFQTSGYEKKRDASPGEGNIIFAATAANVDLVEAAISNRYAVGMLVYRWSSVEGLENPNAYNLLTLHTGNAQSATADFTTINLKISDYNLTTTTDMPWRKIPWTILGPLSFRR